MPLQQTNGGHLGLIERRKVFCMLLTRSCWASAIISASEVLQARLDTKKVCLGGHLEGDPLDGVALEQQVNESHAAGGQAGCHPVRHARLVPLYVAKQLYMVAPIEGGLPHQQLVQDHPHAPQISLHSASPSAAGRQ